MAMCSYEHATGIIIFHNCLDGASRRIDTTIVNIKFFPWSKTDSPKYNNLHKDVSNLLWSAIADISRVGH